MTNTNASGGKYWEAGRAAGEMGISKRPPANYNAAHQQQWISGYEVGYSPESDDDLWHDLWERDEFGARG